MTNSKCFKVSMAVAAVWVALLGFAAVSHASNGGKCPPIVKTSLAGLFDRYDRDSDAEHLQSFKSLIDTADCIDIMAEWVYDRAWLIGFDSASEYIWNRLDERAESKGVQSASSGGVDPLGGLTDAQINRINAGINAAVEHHVAKAKAGFDELIRAEFALLIPDSDLVESVDRNARRLDGRIDAIEDDEIPRIDGRIKDNGDLIGQNFEDIGDISALGTLIDPNGIFKARDAVRDLTAAIVGLHAAVGAAHSDINNLDNRTWMGGDTSIREWIDQNATTAKSNSDALGKLQGSVAIILKELQSQAHITSRLFTWEKVAYHHLPSPNSPIRISAVGYASGAKKYRATISAPESLAWKWVLFRDNEKVGGADQSTEHFYFDCIDSANYELKAVGTSFLGNALARFKGSCT